MSDATERATRRIPRGLVVVAVLVIVAVTSVVLLRRGDDAPASPRAAAQQWAQAVLDGRSDDARALQCRRDVHTELDTLAQTAPGASGIEAGPARPAGSDEWRVPLVTQPAATGTTYTVTVVRRDRAYLVCD